jgi:DNA-binding winged helix-turn-helix (wHTH) protein
VRVTFGDVTLDAEARQLWRGGEAVPLSRKAFELLELLVKEHPRALGKAEIRDHLWPGTFVADSSLTNLMTRLREALDDSARKPRYVRTVQGFGYAFCAELSQSSERSTTGRRRSGPRFSLRWAGNEIALREGENIIGREEQAAAWIESASVSRRHARIVLQQGTVTLEDLGSKNGTFLRGRRIESRVALTDGDEIFVGGVPLRLRVFGMASSTRTGSKA